MKTYLTDTFIFNDVANKKLLGKIKLLGDKTECIKLFSHLINCQYKWMARIMHDPGYEKLSWWDPVYELDKLDGEWNKSLQVWLDYLRQKTNDEIKQEVIFTGFDDARWAVTPEDIALQLNYHSIHHRAQIQTLIRKQGVEPEFVDYIGTKYRRVG